MVALSFPIIWPYLLAVLAASLIASGLDDLVPTFICLWRLLRRDRSEYALLAPAPFSKERRIAIFVPCWKESAVIERMIRHNLAAVRYRNFDFFLGVYPNDEATVEAVERLTRGFRNVHAACCPHPGPTSKADCLNWIYQRMLLYEEDRGVAFDTVVMHDAEDMIHPEALNVIDRHRDRYEMVQVPVLPLPTPFAEFTHGIYIDDFAEFQTIDVPARQWSGSFLPSNGVGTAFSRDLLSRMASEHGNRIFEPASLTEDYECGLAVYQLGFSQVFTRLSGGREHVTATREYFPRAFWPAVRQRTRWVMGIALQSWERNGWRGSWLNRYWFWRDRKGLVANPLGFLTNVLFAAGVVDGIASQVAHRPWAFAVHNRSIQVLCATTLTLQCLRLGIRMLCVARWFGVGCAAGVPLRAGYANLINCVATFRAVFGYAKARLMGLPLAWLKTEHAYPNREALRFHRRDLADVLVGAGYLDREMLLVIQKKARGEDLADFLVQHGLLSDENLCEAMSLQSGLPAVYVNPREVNPNVVRALPAHIERRFRVLAFRLEAGRLYVAGPKPPSPVLVRELKEFTTLPVEFQLVTWRNYLQLLELF
ncbi:MAG TPA: glycosyl transferase family protein [Bryobacteraceae bacterium]|jgi:adsorption protein B|nr:glycosyl transferase family protein [Bryobacteraceae bacterium]